ncbi:uncharacterized protein LOC114468984 [Gouania willdenowi]|uniref:Uncharacterized LOC114468984 n=1 Tax=Gouania willdenowi TaxID=441366 RepID=A0A8C5G7S1_GOUWI|nr:uncharacterized protein LOC114468984 [Gouania willdenowi]
MEDGRARASDPVGGNSVVSGSARLFPAQHAELRAGQSQQRLRRADPQGWSTGLRRGGQAAVKHETAPRGNMNGAVYISFFQGQLESVLEQVVQLAVQEISKSVGSSLNALLLETAVKEQENRRLRLQLQARDGAGGAPLLPGNKAGEGVEPSGASATRRLEQRGRVVDQLKCVMEQVLDFAVRELTKIVEASFDDLLLEITKMESEQLLLEQRLGGGGAERGGRRRGSENNAEEAELSTAKDRVWTGVSSEPPCPPVLSVSQDWVPILDKVFGQRWCRDVWQIKELSAKGKGDGPEPLSASPIALEPSPSSPSRTPAGPPWRTWRCCLLTMTTARLLLPAPTQDQDHQTDQNLRLDQDHLSAPNGGAPQLPCYIVCSLCRLS